MLYSLLAQAEALLSACRVLVARNDPQLGALKVKEQPPFERSADAETEPLPAAPRTMLQQSRRSKRENRAAEAIGLDLNQLQLLKERFPSLGRGPLTVLCILRSNAGQIVSAETLRGLLRSGSVKCVTVYASRLRTALAKNRVDIQIVAASGGYGLSTESAVKLDAYLRLPLS